MGLKNLLSLIVMSLSLTACSVFFSGDEPLQQEIEEQESRTPDALMRSFVRTAYGEKGEILWQLKAREGRIFDELNQMYLTDFIFYSFDEAGQLSSTFRARRGILDNNSGVLTGKLDVVLRSENGRVLETSEVFYDQDEKIISNEVLNKITQEDGTAMIGTHLWAHNDLKVFKLRGTSGEAPEDAEFFDGAESSARSQAASSAPAQEQAISSLSSARASEEAGSSSAESADPEVNLWRELSEDELDEIRAGIAFPEGLFNPSLSPAGADE